MATAVDSMLTSTSSSHMAAVMMDTAGTVVDRSPSEAEVAAVAAETSDIPPASIAGRHGHSSSSSPPDWPPVQNRTALIPN